MRFVDTVANAATKLRRRLGLERQAPWDIAMDELRSRQSARMNDPVVARIVPGMSRLKWTCEGQARLAYTAIDPARQLFSCNCGKAMCKIAGLTPFREHIKGLYNAIASTTELQFIAAQLDLEGEWQATMFSLQMAASIEDAFANTSYVEIDDTDWMCSPYDDGILSSEIAAKYVAGLAIFNFLWGAYEAAIKAAAQGLFTADSTAVRGRKLGLHLSNLEDDIPSLSTIYRLAVYACKRGGKLEDAIATIEGRQRLSGLGAAAELCRIFRNHVAHGDDVVPKFDSDWDEKGAGDANFVVARFYGVGRLLLLLIQAFACFKLIDPFTLMPIGLADFDEVKAGKLIFLRLQVVD